MIGSDENARGSRKNSGVQKNADARQRKKPGTRRRQGGERKKRHDGWKSCGARQRSRGDAQKKKLDEGRKKEGELKKNNDELKSKPEGLKRNDAGPRKRDDRAEEERQRREREQQKAERARQEAERAAAEARAQQEEAERQLRAGAQPVIVPSLQQIREAKQRFQYQDGYLHVAVGGIAGSGKSSLINALRGLRNGDPGAAQTGIVETTSDIARYPDPDPNKRIVWYDVPGAGTLSIPDWVYFTDQGLYVFDCILVLFDARFTATDTAILRNCARFLIPAFVVRSKARQHIRNLARDIGGGGEDSDGEDEDGKATAVMARAREQYVRESRESVSRNLEVAELPQQRVYLVDKQTLAPLVKGQGPGDAIDEKDLLDALSQEARRK
ncbi:hypothetical protein DAEQUDRAFT_811129 [Daedalea quercina L-15889]|uniref:IRG-type G domain-containing protein n=1 Tax=Daedalea quercina L-15889 TaxID=1314783 RepID=A0A165QS01_9APHY|nr:hypothetical protein DAEQUDRAFT_811129 [Daedalea quercina L-15889]